MQGAYTNVHSFPNPLFFFFLCLANPSALAFQVIGIVLGILISIYHSASMCNALKPFVCAKYVQRRSDPLSSHACPAHTVGKATGGRHL